MKFFLKGFHSSKKIKDVEKMSLIKMICIHTWNDTIESSSTNVDHPQKDEPIVSLNN